MNPCSTCGRYHRPDERCMCSSEKANKDLYETTINDSFNEITPEIQSNLNEKRMKQLVENSRIHESVPIH